jgi:hypothetical protein
MLPLRPCKFTSHVLVLVTSTFIARGGGRTYDSTRDAMNGKLTDGWKSVMLQYNHNEHYTDLLLRQSPPAAAMRWTLDVVTAVSPGVWQTGSVLL